MSHGHLDQLDNIPVWSRRQQYFFTIVKGESESESNCVSCVANKNCGKSNLRAISFFCCLVTGVRREKEDALQFSTDVF